MDEKFPRRIQVNLMTPEELAIFNLIGEVEKLGAHPILTDVVVLLGEARNKLSDWVDENDYFIKTPPREFLSDILAAFVNGDNLPPQKLISDIEKLINKYLEMHFR